MTLWHLKQIFETKWAPVLLTRTLKLCLTANSRICWRCIKGWLCKDTRKTAIAVDERQPISWAICANVTPDWFNNCWYYKMIGSVFCKGRDTIIHVSVFDPDFVIWKSICPLSFITNLSRERDRAELGNVSLKTAFSDQFPISLWSMKTCSSFFRNKDLLHRQCSMILIKTSNINNHQTQTICIWD